MTWTGNRLICCAPTSYGGTTVHSPICDRADEPLSSDEYAIYRAGHRAIAEEFNRKARDEAEQRALTRTRHPAGKAPRYRAAHMWRQCNCSYPMAAECGVHG